MTCYDCNGCIIKNRASKYLCFDYDPYDGGAIKDKKFCKNAGGTDCTGKMKKKFKSMYNWNWIITWYTYVYF